MSFISVIFGMHIAEGFLPVNWALFWFIAALPFVILSIGAINKLVQEDARLLSLLAFAGAFTFVLSSLKMPSVSGSCSHPTGMGLGAILFGPAVMVLLACIVLLFQAILLAHGGLTTLGANVASMGIVGPFVSYGIYAGLKKLGINRSISVFIAASLGDMATYILTSLQLALAHPAEAGGVYASFTKFMAIFAVTQIPIAIAEGLLTVFIMNLLISYSRDEIDSLMLLKRNPNLI